MYDMEQTNSFRFELNRLERKTQRRVEKALEELRESPTDWRGKVSHMAANKEDNLFRYRIPGMHLFYIIPHRKTTIVMTQLKILT